MCALSGAGVAWAAGRPGHSAVFAVVVGLVVYVGCGPLARGWRAQATRGRDTLLGTGWRGELLAHTVVPVGVGVVVTTGAAAAGGPVAAGQAALLTLSALAGQAWAAYRGPSPWPSYLPNARIAALGWQAIPPIVGAVCGGQAIHRLATDAASAWPWLVAVPVVALLGAVAARGRCA